MGVFFFCAFSFGLRQLLVVVLPGHPPTQKAYSVGQTLLYDGDSDFCLPLTLQAPRGGLQ